MWECQNESARIGGARICSERMCGTGTSYSVGMNSRDEIHSVGTRNARVQCKNVSDSIGINMCQEIGDKECGSLVEC